MLHCCWIITVENVNENSSWLGIAGNAGVISGMTAGCPRHFQPTLAGQKVRTHINTLLNVVVYHSNIVVPKKIGRRFRRFLH